MRALYLSIILVVAAVMISPARALSLPEIPDSLRILSTQEVKNYWVNKMPEPREPSRLAREYHTLIVEYHREVGERHRLIQEIRAGRYDGYARIIMLRHNLQAYLLMGDDVQVAAVRTELEELEAIAQREEAEAARADRLERLIAATERLAAAIENNGGVIPAGVDGIVPFDRDEYDDRPLMTYLYDEIAICRQPVIIHHDSVDHRPHHPDGVAGHGGRRERAPAVVIPYTPGTRPTPGGVVTDPPRSRPNPVRTHPQVRPGPKPSPMPSQPQVRPARAPVQPQVRQAR